MMSSQLQFFLDAQNGSLAFLKEKDQADWSNSIKRDVLAGDTLPAPPPPSPSDTDKYLDTAGVRQAVVLLSPTQPSNANYTFDVKGLLESQKNDTNNDALERFYTLDGGVYGTPFTKRLCIQVNVQGLDGLFVQVTNLDSGDLTYEMAPIPYE
ncbi:MAG: hypothetical protein ABEN55_02690 [Bradymonadaceae bacterium]